MIPRLYAKARARTLTFGAAHVVVVDDAFDRPDGLVEWAVGRRDDFESAPLGTYPGVLLDFLQGNGLMRSALRHHAAASFGLRRSCEAFCRFSIVTTPPARLTPLQRAPHQDPAPLADGTHRFLACVAYLFHDSRLGGTAFYELADAAAYDALRLRRRGAHLPGWGGYITESNAAFRRIGVVPAKWNRLLVYPCDLFHAQHIVRPDLLTREPARGRLTLTAYAVSSVVKGSGGQAW